MTKYCNEIIKQGKRKGETCNNPCKKGSSKCMHHNKNNKAYKNKYYLNTKYDNIRKKISKSIEENKNIIDDINSERKHLTKIINGIDMYLDKDLEYDEGKYIPYDNTNKHNATLRRETLVKRKNNLKQEREELYTMISTLKDAKVIFKKK